MLIQVIALPWKWLFIYPQQDIATINYLVIPVGQQVEYWITTDNVPMSAFFIPQLGSQIYAMAGMRTRLHLLANQVGTFNGLNTQYNGDGFSDMNFLVQVIEPEKMQQWVNTIKNSPHHLTDATYTNLLNPTIGDQPQFFSGAATNLFQNVITTYMHTFGNIHPRENQLKLQKE
jgi:cytochrome o ubiquinol oxidase subunit 2